MSFEILTAKHLNNLKDKIQVQMSAKNLDSSGEASKSLEVQGMKLLGNDYIYFLDQGRGPGKFPPVNNIRDWVRKKLGVPLQDAKSIAFLIGRKISNEGTEIFKNKSKGIELDKLVEETLNELQKELPEEMKTEALTWL